MKLSKSELLELLTEVIKHDYCLGKLTTILEIINIYEPEPHSIFKNFNLIDEIEPTTIILSSDSEDESSDDESSVACFLTEGEEESA